MVNVPSHLILANQPEKKVSKTPTRQWTCGLLLLATVCAPGCNTTIVDPPILDPLSQTAHWVVVDSSLSNRMPIGVVYEEMTEPSTISTVSSTNDYCTNPPSSRSPGVFFVFTKPGKHRLGAYSTRDNSVWDFDFIVEEGRCTVTRLSCANGRCGDGTASNFGSLRARPGRQIDISVRDHECEDGDRVNVMIAGIANGFEATPFPNQEIRNIPATKTVTLPGSGTYLVVMTALNGTGFKGNCSFEDENTGELIISGTSQAKPVVWRTRGGTGTHSGGYIYAPD
jgi:hypothetical protein